MTDYHPLPTTYKLTPISHHSTAQAKDAGQLELFDSLTGRQLKGWSNKLIWGDNKFILSSLANGPIRDEI